MRTRTSLIALAAALGPVALAAPTRYSVKTLGPLSGDRTSVAFGINDRGWVVGSSSSAGYVNSTRTRGFIWKGAGISEIGTTDRQFLPVDINDGGMVAAMAYQRSGATASGAVRYDSKTGTTSFLEGQFGATGSTPYIVGIAADGTIAGQYNPKSPKDHEAVVTWNGMGTALNYIGSQSGVQRSEAMAISEKGDVVGRDDEGWDDGTYGATLHAWMFRNGDMRTSFMGPTGSIYGETTAVSNNGLAAGAYVLEDGSYKYAVWNYTGNGSNSNLEKPSFMSFDPLPNGGMVTGINKNGVVIISEAGRRTMSEGGASSNAYVAVKEAGAYSTYNLNSLVATSDLTGFSIQSALDINNSGQIVGYGKDASGAWRAFVATPVPEPTTMAGFGIALMGLARRRKARSRA